MSALAMPQLSNRQLLCFCQTVTSVSVSAAVTRYFSQCNQLRNMKNSIQNCVSASNFNIRQLSSSVLLHVTQWLPRFRGHYVLSKCREPNDSVISQKTRILGNTAVRTSNIALEMWIIIRHFPNKTNCQQKDIGRSHQNVHSRSQMCPRAFNCLRQHCLLLLHVHTYVVTDSQSATEHTLRSCLYVDVINGITNTIL